MTPEWPLKTIDEISERVGMGPFGSSIKVSTFVDSGVPIISGQHLHGSRLLDGANNFITEEHADALRAANVGKGDVIFTHAGNIGQVAYIPESARYDRYVISQRQFYCRPDRRHILPEYLAYYFGSAQGQHQLLANASQTGVPSIARPVSYLRSIKIPVPSLPEQRSIVHIVGTLDDKIELNRQMNQTLEQIAATLFRSWFVDFDPVRAKMAGRKPEGMDAATAALFPDRLVESQVGEIPEGWRIEQVGDVVTVVGGSTPSTSEPSYWNGDIPFATPKDLSKLSSHLLLETERHITDAGVDRISSGIIPRHSVLLSSRAPIGYLAVNEVPVAVNQGMIVMICDQGLSPWFMLNWAKMNADEFVNRANGTTFLEISKRNFRPIPLVRPTTPLLSAYDAVVEPSFAKLTANLQQSQTLTVLRDLLLPRLLSGELRTLPTMFTEEYP